MANWLLSKEINLKIMNVLANIVLTNSIFSFQECMLNFIIEVLPRKSLSKIVYSQSSVVPFVIHVMFCFMQNTTFCRPSIIHIIKLCSVKCKKKKKENRLVHVTSFIGQ